jgi:hypothetical protein
MAARRSAISYDAMDLPLGGTVRITTTDTTAIRAIHDFLAFQRQDHHAGGGARHVTSGRGGRVEAKSTSPS